EAEGRQRPEGAALVDPVGPRRRSCCPCPKGVGERGDNHERNDRLLAALRDQGDDREKQIAEHLRRQRPTRKVERQALADEGVKQQELCGQVGKRVTGGVVGSGGAEVKRAGKRYIEGERGEMQRIDAGEAAPEEASDRCRI